MSEQVVQAGDGARLRTRADGRADARPLLLVNSLGTDLHLWDAHVDTWTRTHRVLRYDARGHGGSDVPPGPYSIDVMGSDALAVLDGYRVEEADVCGLSLGGIVGLWLCVNAPNRIRRAVLADTAARVGSESAWRDRAVLVREHGMAAVVDTVMERFFSRDFLKTGGHVLERKRSELLSMAVEGYAGSCEALATADLRDGATEVTAPTLVIVGSEDVATPVTDAQHLAHAIPNANLVELQGAGHLSNLEQPDVFSAEVARFLAP